MTKIETLKKGDLFKDQKTNVIRVYDGFNRSTGKYVSYKYYDISSFKEYKKGTLINKDFNE